MSVVKQNSNFGYKSSSMKSVLTQYGLKESRNTKPTTEARVKKQRTWTPEEKRPEFKKKKPFFEETILIEDTQDIVDRKREKDKRVLQMLSDIQRLRYYYYLEYKERLVDKVEKQREEANRLKEREEKMRERREARELREAHRLKRRHQRTPLQHDEEYLKNLPQTDFYRIIREEQKLVKEGKLRSMTAKEQFWNDRLHRNLDVENEKLRPDFQDNSSFADSELADQATQLPRHLQPLSSIPNPDLDRISEGDERSRPSTMRTINRGKSFAKKLESMFPKMELPPLHIFDMDLSQKVDEEEERRLKAIEERFRQRENRKAMYNRMFNLALTHNAVSKRIIEDRMDETSQMMFQREFTTLADLVAKSPHHIVKEDLEEHEVGQTEIAEGPSSPVPQTEETKDVDFEEKESSHGDGEEVEKASLVSTVDLPKTPQTKMIPLTLCELETNLPTKTSVKLSSMWNNYTKVPKKLQPIIRVGGESAQVT